MALVVRPSPIHSVGVYTTTPIRKGTRVVEYAGERITPEEADRRYDGASRTYLYGLDDGAELRRLLAKNCRGCMPPFKKC